MRYTHPQYPRIALYISGDVPREDCPECYGMGYFFAPFSPHDADADGEYSDCIRCNGTGEDTANDAWCYVTMVGDDRRILVERAELSPLDDDAYCSVCGQIGCAHDGR